jgi:hypothetical protein
MSTIFSDFPLDIAMIVVLLSAFSYLLRVVWRYITDLHRDSLAQNKEYIQKYETLIKTIDEHLMLVAKSLDSLTNTLQAYRNTPSDGSAGGAPH